MSFTIEGKTSTITSDGPSTATADPLANPILSPDALRFLIIASTVAVFFGSITCLCCLTYRIRKVKMRRVVVAAFEQGAFDREFVRERMVYMHRSDPDFSHMFPISGPAIPEYFDKLARPCVTGNVDWDAKLDHRNAPLERSFQPLSAQLQTVPTALGEPQPHPHLSSLPLEQQLALLFHASRSKEERERRKLERRHATDDLLVVNAERESELVLSVIITMPRERQLPEGYAGDLVFGTTGFRWRENVAEPTSHAGELYPTRMVY